GRPRGMIAAGDERRGGEMAVGTDETRRARAVAFPGLMQEGPLLVRGIAERAAQLFAGREVLSRTQDGVERSSYGEVVARARRLACSLQRLGIRPRDRVARLRWSS